MAPGLVIVVDCEGQLVKGVGMRCADFQDMMHSSRCLPDIISVSSVVSSLDVASRGSLNPHLFPSRLQQSEGWGRALLISTFNPQMIEPNVISCNFGLHVVSCGPLFVDVDVHCKKVVRHHCCWLRLLANKKGLELWTLRVERYCRNAFMCRINGLAACAQSDGLYAEPCPVVVGSAANAFTMFKP